MSFTDAYVVGVSDGYMLKSMCDRTPLCGTPFLIWVLFLNVVYVLSVFYFVSYVFWK